MTNFHCSSSVHEVGTVDSVAFADFYGAKRYAGVTKDLIWKVYNPSFK